MTGRIGKFRHNAVLAVLPFVIGVLFASSAQAALPAWELAGAAGPTHLPPAADETQVVALEPGVGSFILTFQAQATATLAGNASAADVKSALEALSTIGGAGGSVAVTGAAGGPYTIVFGGSFKGLSQPQITAAAQAGPGAQLKCTGGPITAGLTYEWLANGALATGAGASTDTYTVAPADAGKALQCRAIATTTTGTPPTGPTTGTQVSNPAIVTSGSTGAYPVAPATITAPAAPVGGFSAGNKLICVPGTWTGVVGAFAYQWYRNGVALAGNGANTNEYTMQAADLATAAAFQCAVSGSNANGTVTKVSANRVTAAPTPVPSPAAPVATATATGPSASVTTTTEGGATGYIVANVANVGGVASSGTITVQIGSLPMGIATSGSATGTGWACTPPGAGQTQLTCTSTESVGVEKLSSTLIVPLTIGPTATSGTVDLTVEGGGTVGAGGDEFELPMPISAEPAKPGVQVLWAGAFDENGQPSTQAGGHPARAGAFFRLNTIRNPTGLIIPAGDAKDVDVELPPGFVGNPMVTPRCPLELRMGSPTGSPGCPLTNAVGKVSPLVNIFLADSIGDRVLFNDVPSVGSPAQFTFELVNAEATVVGALRSDSDFGVTVRAPKLPTGPAKVFGALSMLSGNPEGAAGKAFLTNPMSCADQAQTTPITRILANSWGEPDVFDEQQVDIPPVVNCAALEFNPGFTFQPAAESAATGTSAEAKLTVDQAGLLDPSKLAPPHLKKSVVTLPEGMTLNPAAANGLAACSTAQMGLMGTSFPAPNPIRFDMNPVTCPDAAKIGTAEVITPLLEDPIDATLYLAAQTDNPFKSLLAMYIVVEDERTGIVLKLPGKVTPNPVTGQLTAEFDNNPQTPFEELNLKFRGGGPRSTMATPDTCGEFTTKGTFTPWSAPESGPAAETTDSFYIGKGAGGTLACPATKAARSFDLGFEAGTTSPVAGKHSPFTVRITRPDGNQELSTISLSTPPGFAATLKGVAVCSDAQLAQALARSNPGDGAAELASPSCPASSQVGTTTIGVGVGSQPFYVGTGKVYRTGPYKGAPISLTFVVPAVAGPFDLGVQVVRTALRVNPVTAQITAESDPIPQILQGIPLQIRDVRVDIDRPGFALNPTNCEEMGVSAQVTGGSGATKSLSNRFQVDGCKELGFKPKLQLTYKGATKRTGNPGLRAVLTQPEGQANISRTVVLLPLGSFIDNAHINNPCTRAQYAENACPASSILGTATAWSPLLDQPLSGNVYFRSNGGERELPDVVASLKGEVDVELVGFVDAVENKKAGTSRVRNTFAIVPDAAVSKFVLELKGGKVGLIENSKNLCKQKNVATVKMSAHNGRKLSLSPVVKTSCRKKK